MLMSNWSGYYNENGYLNPVSVYTQIKQSTRFIFDILDTPKKYGLHRILYSFTCKVRACNEKNKIEYQITNDSRRKLIKEFMQLPEIRYLFIMNGLMEPNFVKKNL
jgi:hypothetical protein